MTITRINNNIAAINATRNLNRTTFDLEKSLERLSSGLRINRASDDASGLTISEKLRSQIRGLNQALKNAEDAVSLVNTAEGALDETTSILQRIRELSVKAANTGGLDINAIQAAQDEIDSAIQEITRIGQNTQFSTRRLLNGGNAITASAATGYGVTLAQGPATTSLAAGTHYLQISQTSAGSLTVTAGSDGSNIGTGAAVSNSTFETGSYSISVSNVLADQNQGAETEAFALAGGGVATGATLLTAVDNFNGAALVAGDTIAMTGTVADGTAFNFSYTVTGASTLSAFVTALETSINGAVAASGDDVTITLAADGTLAIQENELDVSSQFAITNFAAVVTTTPAVLQSIETQAWVTTGGGAPTGGVDLKSLDDFNGSALVTGDTITVTGTVADGTAFNFSYTVASGADTLATFITALETAINGAVAASGDDVTITLLAGGELQIQEDTLNVGSQLAISAFTVAGNSVTSTATPAAAAVTASNAITSTATAAAAGSAVVSVGGGPAQTVAHNATVTFYGPQPTNELDPTPQIEIQFGTLTEGVDTLAVVQEEWSGSLDGVGR